MGELVGIKQPGEPLEADHAVERGRPVDPAERRRGGEIDPLIAHGLDAGPQRIAVNLAEEIAVPGDLGVEVDDALEIAEKTDV
jgi:hypothetical protein